MNNPNPFVPQGSLLEQQSKRRSRLKLGVFCVLAVGIAGLSAMLIQGCKREETDQNAENNPPSVDTNSYTSTDTNQPPMEASNPPVTPTPVVSAPVPSTPTPTPTPMVTPTPTPVPAENEYVVVKGDTLGKIAKANGITLKTLEDANSDVTPTRLKVGQKLVIPGGAGTTGAAAASETANGVAANTGGDQSYTIKSGDTLIRIAHHFGVSLKALEAENNLTTTHIKVGQKLNIPAKPEVQPSSVNTPPETAPSPQPMPEPAPAPSPGPANPPAGQQ